ncbi:ricin-type beta-trefoil lectin domain protein [Actinoplanes oblitus]|uniref:Ricin-type beta-trefoil lectin domain protein n=1 Tax=Actinoplanes oblitus TaxID=3040509 RepID=A0ABY8WUM9_9ACTN|nr:ricin-type beta-trefoil lectin domain protein [Actinoplanes oblitus]WIM99600.1 ricin-type beta-trefoil lectin domain protein [Actinoplanes oblitus]
MAVAVLLAAIAALLVPASRATAATGRAAGADASAMMAIEAPRHLVNVNSGLCMAARAGSGERPVIQTTCDYNHHDEYWPDQYWILKTDETTPVESSLLHLCVAARGTHETAAVATTCGFWPDQQWAKGRPPGPVTPWFRMSNGAGLCLAARGYAESRVVATTCGFGDDWPDQQWLAV